ncbi:MAG: sugar-binding transcriptional regulator [Chloroflexia bacterium]|nr:sugar-binding transcriptional regulator [Chloroflexia bacterium]
MAIEAADRGRDGRDETLLLADVAQRYYLADQTQEQIARSIGVSRSNVSRMLKEARRLGLVEIRIHHPLAVEPELQAALRERFGLRECLVLAPADGADATPPSERLGALAGRFLSERIGDGETVGVGWGSTVYHVVTSGYLRKRVGVSVVQLMGSVGGATPDIDGAQVAGRLGRALGAKVWYLHAPMVVAEPAVRSGLLRDQHIRRTLEMARRAAVLLVSVGAVTQASGLYRAGYLNDADLEFIQAQGAVGDICGSYFRQDGSPCSLELGERTIAVPAAVMREADLRVGVGLGAAKALPSVGALRAGLVNVLITDDAAAREMLRIAAAETAAVPVGARTA